VVPEQRRHWHYLSRILCTHPIRGYCPCTHCGKIEASSSYPGYRRVVHVIIRSSAASTSGLLEHARTLVGGRCNTKPITFRISTCFLISVFAAHAKRVEVSCSESETTSSGLHGRSRSVYDRHSFLTHSSPYLKHACGCPSPSHNGVKTALHKCTRRCPSRRPSSVRLNVGPKSRSE